MDDLEPYIKQLRKRKKALLIFVPVASILGLILAVGSGVELYGAGYVDLGEGVVSPRMPMLRIIDFYIGVLMGATIAVMVPGLLIFDRIVGRQNDIILRLWDRVEALEGRQQDESQ